MASVRKMPAPAVVPSSPHTPIGARRSWLAAAMVVGALVGHAEPAEACGGAFFPARSESVGVTGHQMAIAISRNETIVWDRLETRGDVQELAWVIPIKEGTRLELASESFFTTLANATAPTVTEPAKSSGGGGGGGGCMGGAATEGAALGAPNQGGGGVEVLGRENVGPYETARLRASAPGALRAWLTENGFAIPKEIEPTLDAYTREGFDFLALKVRPGARGLQPLRLVVPGADPTLPLRMSRAGVGVFADLTFYVLGEGRYSARGFEEVKVASHRLAFVDGKSNYDDVVLDQLEEGGSTRFVVEASQANDALLERHRATADANCVSSGDGRLDDRTGEPPSVVVCAKDDIAAARRHLTGPMWITRLRTRFPAAAFDKDLSFMASADQSPVSPNHVVGTTPSATIAPVTSGLGGSVLAIAGTVLGLAMIQRRARRRVS